MLITLSCFRRLRVTDAAAYRSNTTATSNHCDTTTTSHCCATSTLYCCLLILLLLIHYYNVFCNCRLTGIEALALYLTRTTALPGVGRSPYSMTLVSVVQLVASIAAALVVDSSGRKSVLLRGTACMAVSLLMMSTAVLGLQGWILLQVKDRVIWHI
jgi:Sugar (and other) transporter